MVITATNSCPSHPGATLQSLAGAGGGGGRNSEGLWPRASS